MPKTFNLMNWKIATKIPGGIKITTETKALVYLDDNKKRLLKQDGFTGCLQFFRWLKSNKMLKE